MKKLKRLITVVATCAVAAVAAFGFAACTDEGESDFSYTVAMPDGAPSLAVVQLMVENMQFGGEVDYNVVNSNVIAQQVSGEVADICILPVNAAVQVAGSGETYSLLGTVTHGNLYMLSAKHPDVTITAANLNTLVGKTVGCIQLSSFVGNVFKMILEDNEIPYEVVESVDVAKEEVVNLINIADPATGITPAADFDYMIAAEPVVTAKINGSASSSTPLKLVGDLQELYGEEGYPQAVMVVKNSVLEENETFVSQFVQAVIANVDWITSEDAVMSEIVNAINDNYDGATSSLTADNLNATVISRCAISFTPSYECSEEITNFIEKLEDITESSLTLSENFFVPESFFIDAR